MNMPTIAVPLGLLGIVPFLYFGLNAVGVDAASARLMLVGLIDYAALILTFAGGVHWGMALSPMALGLLCIGYVVAILAEHRAARQWLMPRSYVWLRWGVTVAGLVMMVMVMVLRGIGQAIVF
jgi:hypothetical protein